MSLLLVQMLVVLATALICGWIAVRVGQARVIGEMVGGILLGPSLLGRVAPHVWAALFSASTLKAFDVLSTVGLVVFLFLIGTELDYAHLRQQRGVAALASSLSMAVPFGLAVAIAPLLRSKFAAPDVQALPFLLFLGVSLSITAFPVLARILEERRMQTTRLGTTALLSAAAGDVCAWILLAAAMTLLPHGGEGMSTAERFVWLALYLAVMVGVVRPIAGRFARRRALPSFEAIACMVLVLLASASATEAMGLHALFGAFVAGACFPRVEAWQTAIRSRFEIVASTLLLPFFFALTGMRTRLDLLHGGSIWIWTLAIISLAVAGKMGGAIIASRWAGESWRDAIALGAMLNTRGLVELIVLNIAYGAGVFSATLFTMLVVMAIATTMMTTPLLNLLHVGEESEKKRDEIAVALT